MNRTRRIALLTLATVALAALGNVSSASSHKGHPSERVVKSTVSISFQGGGDDPYAEQANFTGEVGARSGGGHWDRGNHWNGHGHWFGHGGRKGFWSPERECVDDRVVRIVHVPGGEVLRTTTTDRSGAYGVLAGPELVSGDDYRAEVLPKTFWYGGTRVLCRGAVSEAVSAG